MTRSRELLRLEVTGVAAIACDVVTITLAGPDGQPLPPFSAGAHIDVHLPNGLIRNYSLIDDGQSCNTYRIAVGKDRNSRGGSAYIHGFVKCGDTLTVRAPRNNFPLDPVAKRYRFIAGGIGITPIVAMISWCESNNKPWLLHYAVRNRLRTAFYEELIAFGDKVRFHFDDEARTVLNVDTAVGNLQAGEQVYCCGPEPLMRAVETQTSAMPRGSAHFEWFNAPQDDAEPGDSETFTIQLKGDGRSFSVPPDSSILEVLEANGFQVPFSCREGMCATCLTDVCDGVPDHRDYVLTDEEQAEGKQICICVSRAKSSRLVLDL